MIRFLNIEIKRANVVKAAEFVLFYFYFFFDARRANMRYSDYTALTKFMHFEISVHHSTSMKIPDFFFFFSLVENRETRGRK